MLAERFPQRDGVIRRRSGDAIALAGKSHIQDLGGMRLRERHDGSSEAAGPVCACRERTAIIAGTHALHQQAVARRWRSFALIERRRHRRPETSDKNRLC